LPKELTLVSIELYPEKKTMSNFSQSLRFSEGTVIVRGISPDPSYVNAFMNNLGTLPGLETVKLKKYSKNKDKNLNEFNLELKVK
jgi:Tfp pilus assembly protein PilN